MMHGNNPQEIFPLSLGHIDSDLAVMLTIDMKKFQQNPMKIAPNTFDDYISASRMLLEKCNAKVKIEVRLIYDDRVEEKRFEEVREIICDEV